MILFSSFYSIIWDIRLPIEANDDTGLMRKLRSDTDVIGSPMPFLLSVTKILLGTSPMPPMVPDNQSMVLMTTDLINFNKYKSYQQKGCKEFPRHRPHQGCSHQRWFHYILSQSCIWMKKFYFIFYFNFNFNFNFDSKMCSYKKANNLIKESREICNKVTIQETVNSLVEKL